MLLGTLGASLFVNLLTGKGILRAASGNNKGKGIVRAGSGNNKGKGVVRVRYGRPVMRMNQGLMVFIEEIIYLIK